eukprot:2997580-Pyramimonas_sp.AAC.1
MFINSSSDMRLNGHARAPEITSEPFVRFIRFIRRSCRPNGRRSAALSAFAEQKSETRTPKSLAPVSPTSDIRNRDNGSRTTPGVR